VMHTISGNAKQKPVNLDRVDLSKLRDHRLPVVSETVGDDQPSIPSIPPE
jgi:hypothetical protein